MGDMQDFPECILEIGILACLRFRLCHKGNVSCPTVPFANALELKIHFEKHGAKFGVADATTYEALADAFMAGAMNATTTDCTRPNLIDYLRFDTADFRFGVLCLQDHCLRTFYPIKARSVANRGGAARYFAFECARSNL